jgi:hypothetical protein
MFGNAPAERHYLVTRIARSKVPFRFGLCVHLCPSVVSLLLHFG